jgi:hypothetical protein
VNNRTTIAVMLLALLASCSSPIDVPTARIDTKLTNRIKLRSISVNARIERPADTTTIDEWSYTASTAAFAADTSGTPPTLSMNYVLNAQAAGATAAPLVKEVRIALDRVPAQGATTLGTDGSAASNVTATIVVDGVEYTTGAGATASAALYYLPDGKKRIQGTIVLGMNRSPLFTLLLAINFQASQE